jgi:type I restriction enzyme S subunit
MKTWQGSLAISEHAGIVSPAYFVAKPLTESDGRFLHYLLRSKPLIAQYGSRSKGIRPAQWDLPWDEFKEISLYLPPLPTQRRIADFLDRETERIDALIDKKRRLIDLLEEKRIATITHAVTKGLNPAVPMQPSGIPWIGSIPARWKLHKIGHAFELGSGTTPQSDDLSYYDGPVPWVLTGDLPDGPMDKTQKTITAKALADYSALHVYPEDTLVMAMYGATIGKLGRLTSPSAVNQACCAIRPRGAVDSAFTFYWLLANRPHLVALGVGSGQPNISQEIIRQVRIPAPGLEEQRLLVQHLDRQVGAVSQLTNRLATQLCLLAEYREALITASVTGEIDVDTFNSETDLEVATP